MKRTILFSIFILLFSVNLFSQQIDSVFIKELKNNVFTQRQEINTLTKQLNKYQSSISNNQKTIHQLTEKIAAQEKRFESLNNLSETNKKNIETISNELGTKIQETATNTNDKILKIDSTVGKNQLYWLLATLITLLLGGLMYLFIGKKIHLNKTDVETQIKSTKNSIGDIKNQIKDTRKSIEEESIKLDNKLIEILENQLKLKAEEPKIESSSNKEDDHSLALKVADEIIRIQKNLNQMDSNTKGLKQLMSSVKRIQDNFAANGYELVDLLGKEYNDGIKAIVNFIQDENFEKNKRIITRIIKPQVNFEGIMIQTAQIEVTEA